MRKFLIVMLFIGMHKLHAQFMELRGTWVNIEFFNALQHQKPRKNLDSIVPRCIYIDKSNQVTIEFGYEQKSRRSPIGRMTKDNSNRTMFSALERQFTLVNDSLLLLSNYGRKMFFKKIGSEEFVGNGIQLLLRWYFWSHYKKWNLITVNNNTPTDTAIVTIGRTKISSTEKSPIVSQYEFMDTKQYNINGEELFGIDFFTTNVSYMTTSNNIFGIKKLGDEIYLYKDTILYFRLIPVK